MKKNKILSTIKLIIKIMMCIQIIIGIIFIIRNIDYMPEYGDSVEFLQISQTMKLDSYRPFIYPVVLNISSHIANFLNINITYIIFTIQLVINLLACFILIYTLNKILELKLNKKDITLYSLFVFFIPFNIHFNMSVQYDSLATSFTIMFICCLMNYIKEQKYGYAVGTLICMFISSNIRSERIYFLSCMLIVLIIIELLHYVIKKKINLKKLLVLLIILVVGIVTTNISKEIFQDENANERAQPTISMYLYERIVGNTLPKIYEYLPENIKEKISYEDAIYSSKSANLYKAVYEALYKESGNLKDINEIMKVAIIRNFPNITLNIISDFLKNIVSPYYAIATQEQGTINYTITKMGGNHRLYTEAYVLYFTILFVMINVYLALKVFWKKIKIKNYKELIVILLYTIINAGFFATLTGQNFNIRYTIPVYVMEIAILTMIFAQEEIDEHRGI